MNRVEFFLKDSALQTILKSYPTIPANPTHNFFKGLVIRIEVESDVETDLNDIKFKAEVRSVCGTLDDHLNVPDNPVGNSQVLCPHPPPCTFDLAGKFLSVDFQNPDGACYK